MIGQFRSNINHYLKKSEAIVIPLLWIGAGIAAWKTGEYLDKERQRSAKIIESFPGDIDHPVAPVDGSIVCCGIYELFEHTGIWLEEGIVELAGSGLVRAISPQRFISDRSGEKVFVACDSNAAPLIKQRTAQKAMSKIYSYADYHVINNNCHRFVAECVSGETQAITLFSDLNHFLAKSFNTTVHWHPVLHD